MFHLTLPGDVAWLVLHMILIMGLSTKEHCIKTKSVRLPIVVITVIAK